MRITQRKGDEDMKRGTRFSLTSLAAAVIIAISYISLPIYSDDIQYRFVDLSPYVTNDATYGLTLGYSRLPINTVIQSEHSGVPFKVFSKGSKIFIGLEGWWPRNPSSVEIEFNDYAYVIYFFGHVYAHPPVDAIHGEYVIQYEDNSSIGIRLNGRADSSFYNIDDHCCNWRSENLRRAFLAWKDHTQPGKPALIREFRWVNPTPNMKIKSIAFIDSGTVVSPMLFAITYVPVQH